MSLSSEEVKKIQRAVFDLISAKNLPDAWGLCQTLLEDNPNDAIALNFMGVIYLEKHDFPHAYQFFRRSLAENPNPAPVWANFGLAAHELGRNEEAIGSYLKSAQQNNEYAKAYANAAAVFVEESRWDDVKKSCELALQVEPDNSLAKQNLSHYYLAKHEWKKAWELWELTLGSKYRKEWTYDCGEKRWDGTKGLRLVIQGEQGLGDEIMYASVIPDAIADSASVIVDCDPRLEKLFARSFPTAKVYGTRRDEHPSWLQDAKIDARVAMASMPYFYRNADNDFPGTPYLKADPALVEMFKAYWRTLGKPVYGVCTHGGTKTHNAEGRTIEPEQFSPLFALDAEFVCLDYKAKHNNPRLRYMPWVTQASDYDVTAALIASLDAVIGVNTTAIHCANGLGVPTHILVPVHHQWRYEAPYVWSKAATLYQQRKGDSWRDVIKRVKL